MASPPAALPAWARVGAFLALLAVVWPAPSLGEGTSGTPYPAKAAPTVVSSGRFIQRSMRLLSESRPSQSNTVRVLFYGQSITAQKWSHEVERSLRARFPHAELVVENRALGGYPSQLLVKTAETDLYSFYPDLLIFHVYGAHDKYEDIIRRVRERTTAEILLQTDHLTTPDELAEERDATRVSIEKSPWSTFMNQSWLPGVSRRFQAALCDQRTSWKEYLALHELAPSALLSDEVHLNARGEWLMAECVKDCLRRSRGQGESPAEKWVRTSWLGRELHWEDGVLKASFEGNRIDAVFASLPSTGDQAGGPRTHMTITIDGKRPSEWQELYGLTRALPTPGGKWPALFEIGARARLVPERWSMLVSTVSRDPERYAFRLIGSQTGPDGEGRSDQDFVSNSGRVVIEPSDWGVAYAMGLAGVGSVPDHFTIAWDVVPRFVDQFEPPIPGRRGVGPVVTLAQGLPNGPHVIELRGPSAALRGLRVYRPALPASDRSGPPISPKKP